jgi:hypothetical protein
MQLKPLQCQCLSVRCQVQLTCWSGRCQLQLLRVWLRVKQQHSQQLSSNPCMLPQLALKQQQQLLQGLASNAQQQQQQQNPQPQHASAAQQMGKAGMLLLDAAIMF